MDADRVQRLGALVGIGIASQVANEVMQAKSSAHSFWLIVALSLGMIVVQSILEAIEAFDRHLKQQDTYVARNFVGWLRTLAQTTTGVETIVWTLYGSAVGQWVLRMYTDLYTVPTFLYFLPLYAFLFGFLSVNLSTQKRFMSAPPDTGPSFQEVVRRLEKLEAASSDSVNIDVMKLIY